MIENTNSSRRITLSMKVISSLTWFLGITPINPIRNESSTKVKTDGKFQYFIKNGLLVMVVSLLHWQGSLYCTKTKNFQQWIFLAGFTLNITCVIIRLLLFVVHQIQIVKVYNEVQALLQSFSDSDFLSHQRLYLFETIGLVLISTFYIVSYFIPLPAPCQEKFNHIAKTLSYVMVGGSDLLVSVMCTNTIFIQKVAFRNLWLESMNELTMGRMDLIWRKYIKLLKLNKIVNKVCGFSIFSIFINFYTTSLYSSYLIYKTLAVYTGSELYLFMLVFHNIFRLLLLVAIIKQISQCKSYFYKIRCELAIFKNEELNLNEVRYSLTCK